MDQQEGPQEHVGEGQPQESETRPTEHRHSEENSPGEGVADTESRSASDDASLVGEGGEEGGSGAPAPAGEGGQTAQENEDRWFYLDDGGEERGPYSLQEMLTWWNCQLLRPDLPVRRGAETEYTTLSTRPEFNPYYAYYAHYYSSQSSASSSSVASELTAAETGTATTATATATTDYHATGGPLGDHTAAGGYYAAGTQPYGSAPRQSDADRELAARLMAESNYTQVGSFNARTGRFQVQKRGYDDPAGRQIAHYFDEQAWQQQAQQSKPKKIKLTKKEIQKFKEKKKKKKIPAYLLDD